MINITPSGAQEIDFVIGASLVGLWQFGMYEAQDPKIWLP
jgi:GH15 family glucan-1,4-alpha-glucosidase